VTIRSPFRILLVLLFALACLPQGACWSNKKEYNILPEAELTTYVEIMPDSQKRRFAQDAQMRKQMIDEFKRRYALAQAALAEGMDKSEDYTRNFAFTTARLLTQEHGKRNPDSQVSKAEIDAYVAAHQKEFEADVAFFTKRSNLPTTAEQMEGYKASWGELQVRAERARQAGIDKETALQVQLKIIRAELLANLYAGKLQKQFEITDADYQGYYQQHPEADPERIKKRMDDLLTRLKKGEAFEKIADEVNEDGTRGRGGDLDWFGKGTMDPDFEKAAFVMQPGQTSQEPVKTNFGYHLIKLEGRRKASDKPAAPGATANGANPAPAAPPTDPNAEEVRAKHIYLSTKMAGDALAQQANEKVKRAMEDATLKYPVMAPEDFKVTVAGLRPPSATPLPGGGMSGTMPMITPNPGK
jgi:hypothetical protein